MLRDEVLIEAVGRACLVIKADLSTTEGASLSMERSMLQLRPNCEYCDKDLPPNAIDARICTYECTFCADCVDRLLFNVCPNCGVTDFGFRVVLFFTRIYHRLLRPTLAAALSAIPAVTTPLKRAFDALDAQINTMINQAQLAAQNLTRLRQVPFVKQG